jgi:hypothetical protein
MVKKFYAEGAYFTSKFDAKHVLPDGSVGIPSLNYRMTHLDTPGAKRIDLTELFEACEVFVFHPDSEPEEFSIGHEEAEIDPPFQCFSIEQAGQVMGFFPTRLKDNMRDPIETTIAYTCIAVMEAVGPAVDRLKKYIVVAHVLRPGWPKDGFVLVSTYDSPPLVGSYLGKLNRGSVGVIERAERISWKSEKNPKKKESLIKNHTFVVAPKKYQNTPEHRDVNWSHRWNVRGHWRWLKNPQTIGKNREGEYCVQGRTWVKHSVKGPEHVPIVKKQRIVKD